MTPELRMRRARTRLLLEHPFFGTLAMRLNATRDDTINPPTMCTNGRDLIYHGPFVETLSDPELIGVYAHEVEHCALLHVFRRGTRDAYEWNVACDYAINQLLVDAGLTLPQGALIDAQYKGMSAEQIYAKRKSQGNPQPKQGKGQGQGQGKGKPCPTGTFEDAPKADSKDSGGKGSSGGPKPQHGQEKGQENDPGDGSGDIPTEQDWKIAAEQAAMAARKAGKMPGEADRQMRNGRQSPQDWKQILREFVAATIPSDYSWSHPNRRYVATGLYLPGMVKENTGELVLAVDTSGSIDGPMLASFNTEIQAIADEAKPEKIHVVYCDARVQKTDEFLPGDELILKAKGGGGTNFQPVFDWVEEKEIQPKALIYLTDLECGDRPSAPDYPVLWVAPEWANRGVEFGEIVRMSE